MTFSIVAYNPKNGDFGIAVQSKFICVGSIVPWAKANIGAVATQAMANTTFGPRGLELLGKGYTSEEVIVELLKDDQLKDQRQVAVIDKTGKAAAWTGKDCFYWAGHKIGKNYSCQGNILVSEDTINEMAKAFESSKGDLADKLIATLASVDEFPKYGDVRGKQSAALLIVREKGGYGGYTDKWIDIRVDEHSEPIQELHRIFNLYSMIFLEREDESNLWDIEGEIEHNIKDVLIELNYLKTEAVSREELQTALENWTGINNFENKLVENKIWKSVYDYMMEVKGTPMVSLRKMSE
ncbi:MAG: DUF1028 domain-containing protein [Candidatus Lokiarchaeota archaeon]|nr:DUF1028 domain-containing protein [Candidatus Lokiarchaeota archaeon]